MTKASVAEMSCLLILCYVPCSKVSLTFIVILANLDCIHPLGLAYSLECPFHHICGMSHHKLDIVHSYVTAVLYHTVYKWALWVLDSGTEE